MRRFERGYTRDDARRTGARSDRVAQRVSACVGVCVCMCMCMCMCMDAASQSTQPHAGAISRRSRLRCAGRGARHTDRGRV